MPIVGNQSISKVSKKPRKQRQPKACYPCRQRKVKCDGVPCSSCALRSHPQLCSMEPCSGLESRSGSFEPSTNPSLTATVGENTSWGTPHISDGDPRAGARRAPPVSRAESRDAPDSEGQGQLSSILPLPPTSPDFISNYNAVDPSLRQTSSFEGGQASSAVDNSAILMGISQPTPQHLHRTWSETLFELIGDGQDVVLPFEDLYSPRKTIADLCLALPSNTQIQRYYQMYTDILLPIYPGLVDPELFDAQLHSLLDNRDQVITNANNISGALNHQDASWFALLFAVIACGAQCISTIDREAELNSKVFGSISFSCLRKVNYLINPSLNSIQALLNIGISLRNDMHSSVAWSLLGLTIRHAQVIGCCEVHATPMNRNASDDSHNAKLRLWWAIVWQDVTLSFCYGRPCGSLSAKAQFPPILDPNGRYSFTDVINRVCGVCHDFCRQELLTEEADKCLPQQQVEKLVQRIEDIHLKAEPHLLDVVNCISPRQHVEYFALTIYKNHAAAHLLNSIIEAPLAEDSDAYHPILCKLTEKSVAIVESFLKLRQFSILSSHYWSLIQATITAAKFLLTQGRGVDRLESSCLVRSLMVSLGSSYDETTSIRNGFSANLSKLVAELSMLLDT